MEPNCSVLVSKPDAFGERTLAYVTTNDKGKILCITTEKSTMPLSEMRSISKTLGYSLITHLN